MRQDCGDRGKRILEPLKRFRQIVRAELLEESSVQQTRPENRSSHVGHLSPGHSRRQSRANDATNAGSGDDGGPDPCLMQGLDYANVRESAYSTATQGEPNALGLK